MNNYEIIEVFARNFNGEPWDKKGTFSTNFFDWLKEMLNIAREDERRKIISYLKSKNPYPADIFMGNNKKIKAILYADGTQSSPDGEFGSFGRHVWNNIIKELEEMEWPT
ncbi:MAG: hypothetical protein QXS81_01275 [Candidatus Micrarchaeaceae archaeon]